jgi:arylsulfatase A-like enzyme
LGSVQRGSPFHPGAHGFDVWKSSPNFFDLDPILSDQGRAVPFEGDSSDVTVDVALEFIRECAASQQRFLAVVWFGSPHVPHQALAKDREPYAGMEEEHRHFLGEITAMDRAFGRLRDALRDLGIRDNTLLWYCSDNGALPQVGSTGGRRGLKASIYEGGLSVPALLEWPAMFGTPRVIDTPCVTSDIFPTLLDVAGVRVENPRQLDGISLLPALNGDRGNRAQPIGFWAYPTNGISTPAREWMRDLYEAQQAGGEPDHPERLFADADEIGEPLSLDRFPGHAAWLEGSWKLHRIENRQSGAVTWELYDLAADPDESENLWTREESRVAGMRGGLEAWLRFVVQSHNGGDY